MKLLLGFLALCFVHCIVADFESYDLNDEIQQRITDVLEAPKISLSGSDPSDHALRLRQFRQFVSVFRRHYASNFELRSRFEAFKSNMEKKEHYEAKETGTAQYGMTEFMDYEENELSRFSRMCKEEPDLSEAEGELFQNMVEVGNQLLHDQPLKEAPASVDYRKKGWVSKVLDQGYCSSSWAYAAVTALETANAIKTGHFERLSKQQLIDCDKLNHGCCGGYIHLAYLYINQTGIELDATYNGRKGDFMKPESRLKQRPAGQVVTFEHLKLVGSSNVYIADLFCFASHSRDDQDSNLEPHRAVEQDDEPMPD